MRVLGIEVVQPAEPGSGTLLYEFSNIFICHPMYELTLKLLVQMLNAQVQYYTFILKIRDKGVDNRQVLGINSVANTCCFNYDLTCPSRMFRGCHLTIDMSSGDQGQINASCCMCSLHDSGNWKICNRWLEDGRNVMEIILVMMKGPDR